MCDDYCESMSEIDAAYASITEPLDALDEPDVDDRSPDDFVSFDFFELETSKNLKAPDVYKNYIY